MTRLTDFVAGRSLAEIYDEEWVPAVLVPFARGLQELVSEGQAVLDVGCGTGIVTQYAAEKCGSNGRVVGIDPTGFLLERAHLRSMRAPAEWIDGSVENMPFDDDSFDVVLCHQALQYMEDPALAVRAMARVAKPGGTVAVSVWSPMERQIPIRDFEDVIARHLDPEIATLHAYSFGGLEVLRSIVEPSGLKVVSAERLSHPTVYRSVAHCAELMLAGAGRALPDGSMGMGLFDLEDPRYVQGVEDLIADLEGCWADYVQPDGHLEVPYFTDLVVGAKAR